MTLAPRDRLIVALDLPSVIDAAVTVARFGDSVSFYKIGYELILAGGLHLIDGLVKEGKKVFLDLKLHDISNTVTKAVEQASRLGITFLTVHGYPLTMRAAVEGRKGSKLKLLAVTVLTSYDDSDLMEAGYAVNADVLAAVRASHAIELGIDGIICSPHEVAKIREGLGSNLLVVTPGIRPTSSAPGDQKRYMSPTEAIYAGADYLVIGRPILQSPDPVQAVETIIESLSHHAQIP